MTTVPTQAEVVVVGGGPAGATLAGLLAQRGHDVLVLERARFPRYHVGESLITGMRSVVAELGLEGRLEQAGFEHKRGLCLVWGRDREVWPIDFAEASPYEHSFHVDRDRFDLLLLDRARELGAEVRQETRVRGPRLSHERVVGVRVDSPDGPVEVDADLVVDASGQARVVARHVDEPRMLDDLRCLATWTYFEDVERLPPPLNSHILVEKTRPGQGWFWTIPLPGGRTSVGLVEPIDELGSGGPNERFRAALEATRETSRLVGDAEHVEPFRTARDWSYLPTKAAGHGWASVGDAAGFIDPLLSTGVCLGMLQAHALATAVDLGRRRPAVRTAALERYDRGCREFLDAMAEYVRFFYDAERDLEDYQTLAQRMADPAGLGTARQAFVAVVSGTSSLGDTFRFGDLESSPVSIAQA